VNAPGTGDESAAIAALRSRGDARADQGLTDAADEAWNAALLIARTWLEDPRAEQIHPPAERANFFGIRGGLERRLRQFERALISYRRGAKLEKDHALPSTYNRANAIKLALITGDRTVAALQQDLVELRDALQRHSAPDTSIDDAWHWADLGDVQLLLGEDSDAAESYRKFTDRAQSTSPESTLRVIKEVATKLRDHGDDAADRVGRSVVVAERVLRS
jgi:hypothetical protein